MVYGVCVKLSLYCEQTGQDRKLEAQILLLKQGGTDPTCETKKKGLKRKYCESFL